MRNLHAVVLAGGSGTRFWPASRALRPKQLLPLAGGETLLAATLGRIRDLVPAERTWIITNPQLAAPIQAALPGFPRSQLVVEPEPRDTAPCVALAAARIAAVDADATLAVMPADHIIHPAAAFHDLMRRGAELAADGRTLVTFGVNPTRPATSYGYIEVGEALPGSGAGAYRVARFREKPDLQTAKEFFVSGRFLWNSGIFVWTVPALLAAMEVGNPELAGCAVAMLEAARRGDEATLAIAFRRAPKISIDYAVMEKAPAVAVLRAELEWDDIGSFVRLATVTGQDGEGNSVFQGEGTRAVLHEADGNVVYGEGRRAIALFGVHDLVVVAVDDAVLVCPKSRADDLKVLIQRLRSQGCADLL